MAARGRAVSCTGHDSVAGPPPRCPDPKVGEPKNALDVVRRNRGPCRRTLYSGILPGSFFVHMKEGTLKWMFVGDLVISLVTGGQLTDRDWDRFIEEQRTRPVKRYIATVVGGAIEVSSMQRKKYVDFWKTKNFPIAVVTD